MDDNKFKFDVVIGNPPYQEELEGTSDKPIYPKFIDESYKVGKIVKLITPGRFLFNAGKTPKKWNNKMLNNPKVKVLYYEQDGRKVFRNTGITGGVAVTYFNIDDNHDPIGTFTPFKQLNSILKKVTNNKGFNCFNKIIYSSESYKLTKKFHEDFPNSVNSLGKGHMFDITTNIFQKIPEVFFENRPDDEEDYIKIYGLENRNRIYKYIKKTYVNNTININKFKVILPKSNGSKAIGESGATSLIGTPLIGTPFVGTTQTFITIGAFDTKEESLAVLKYVKSKFARVMLGTLKITQHNPASTWSNVPMQDFTNDSDIDWSKSIPEIDKQLYKKYGLDEDEINFIESHVKEMD